MFIDDVAKAFNENDKRMVVTKGTKISRAQVNVPKNGVQRFLASFKNDLKDNIRKDYFGEVEAIISDLYVFSDTPDRAINELKAILMEIYVNHAGNLGQGKMPRDYGGVKFWKFHPANKSGNRVEEIKEFTEFWRPDWAKGGGFHVAHCTLKIAGIKI